MADHHNDSPWAELTRREALSRLLGVPVHLGLFGALGGAVLEAQARRPKNLRIIASVEPRATSPIVQGQFPRTLLTPASVAALRSQIATDPAFRARWQAAVSSFEAAGGYWATNSTNALTNAFAAVLACVRRPNNDLGLTWASPWSTYKDRIVAAAQSWNHTGQSGTHALAHGIAYDMLHDDLTPGERGQLHGWIMSLLEAKAVRFQSSGGHWDDQTSDMHAARVVLSVVADDARGRLSEALQESLDYARAHEVMQYGEGIAYSWKDEAVCNISPVFTLWVLRNAMGLSDAETIDNCLTSFRDTWQHVRQFTIPHPGYGSVTQWKQARVNFQQPILTTHRGLNVAANMLWAMSLLPGKVKLTNDGTLTNQPKLANDEDALLGYAHYILQQPFPGAGPERVMLNAVTNFKWVFTGAPTPERGHMQSFLALVPWLISNVKLAPPKTPADAGIPRVRRWWPGTLNWVTIIGGTWESGADQSLIAYSHRRWYSVAYTAGTAQNGMWQVHRGGPLLIKRGSTSHGPVGKTTWAGNGTIGFYDTRNPEFVLGPDLDEDRGDIRTNKNHDHLQDILDDPAADFGQITSWHADSQVVALTSDLTRSYNSTEVTTNGGVKIAAFTREFVCVQRGGDGTSHERIFTYDRLSVLGDGRYQPRYNLCPATDPNIDGTEVAYKPWYPGSAGLSVSDPVDAPWKANGPVRWDYTGATRLIYDSSTQSAPVHGGTSPGNGKVCVTWLEPRGNAVAVRKRGGTAMVFDPPVKGKVNGSPSFGPYGELRGKDGAWDDVNDPARWMFAGLYTVQVMPATFNPDTRFLMACDVMNSGEAPDVASTLTCDGGSVAARCGASVVVFAKSAGGHSAGSVTIPDGVNLVLLANLPAGAARTLSGSGGLRITSASRTPPAGLANPGSPNVLGCLVLAVSGSGTLTFS